MVFMENSKLTAFIATSLREQDSEINTWFGELLRSFAIEPFFGDEPKTEAIPEKVRKEIINHPIFVAILPKRTKIEGDKWLPPEWVNNEIGIAYGNNKKIIAFLENDVITEGIVPDITNYVRFDRDKLLTSMPEIIKLILSIFQNEFQEIKYMPLKNIQALVSGLEVIYRYFYNVKTIKIIENEITSGEVFFSGIFVKNGEFMPIIRGGFENTNLKQGIKLCLYRLISIEDDFLEELIGKITITKVQEKLSQGRFDEIYIQEFYDEYSKKDGFNKIFQNKISVNYPEGTGVISLSSLEAFLKIIDEIIYQGKSQLTNMMGEIVG